MKMQAENFKQFKAHLLKFRAQHEDVVKPADWSNERWRWEWYHACNEQHLRTGGNFVLRPLVTGLNDNHIDTALRKVFDE